jgi:predicted ATP-dependent endonuclease of OLD family
MNVLELRIKNLRKISDVTLKFNKPLILLYGDIQQGKTTFLDAIKILFSDGFPDDLIQHGKTKASIELILENGVVSRSFYINKTGKIIGKPINAIVNNKQLKQADLNLLFNPFQLNQDHLKEMSTLKRKQFFVELFNVDTKEIDKLILNNEFAAKSLKKDIAALGNIELIEVKEPDFEAVEKEEKEIRLKLNKQVLEIRAENKALKDKWEIDNKKHLDDIKKFNYKQEQLSLHNVLLLNKGEDLKAAHFSYKQLTGLDLVNLDEKIDEIYSNRNKPKSEKPLTSIPEPEYKPEHVDQSELDNILIKKGSLGAEQLKYDNYIKEKENLALKEKKEDNLKIINIELKRLRKAKIEKLAEYGKEVEGLEFDESGSLNYQGIANDNLSTSQIVELGSKLSKLYPDSLLDLELLDRGESLGKSIFNYVDKAKEEGKTILATIVGEKPAIIPEDVGVFIVEEGELK